MADDKAAGKKTPAKEESQDDTASTESAASDEASDGHATTEAPGETQSALEPPPSGDLRGDETPENEAPFTPEQAKEADEVPAGDDLGRQQVQAKKDVEDSRGFVTGEHP